MSESKPGSSAGTGLIVAVIVAAVLGVPCLIGMLLFVVGGLFYARSSKPIPPPPDAVQFRDSGPRGEDDRSAAFCRVGTVFA